MEPLEAIKVVSRYWPCPHANVEKLGTGMYWGKCHDCNAEITFDNTAKYKKNAADFSAAIDCLIALIEPAKKST